MAYSNVWSNSAPLGTAAANTIADELQKLRLDVDERIDDLVGDWSTDDPVTLAKTGRLKVYKSGVQSIPNASLTSVQWDAELFDVGSMWVVGSPTTITIPADGEYLCSATVQFAANSTGQRGVQFDNIVGTEEARVIHDAAASGVTGLSVTAVFQFDESDTFTVAVYQDSTGGLNLDVGYSTCSVFMLHGAAGTS